MRKATTAVVICGIAIVIVAIVFATRHPNEWTGFRNDPATKPTVIGTYSSFELCAKDVETTGGWCGRKCTAYPNGSYADCNPLTPIPKKP
jgi:hypothetical protein